MATAIAASGLAPKGVDTTEKVLVAIMAGAELGFAPFQAMQSFAVINGKPNIWGDALPALLWSRGFEIDEWFDNDDEPTKAFCKITRPGGKEIERSFSVAQAKQAGLLGKQGPWQQYQSRMLQMRARAFAARDGASDVLRGMLVAEEVQDYQPITARRVPAEGPGLAARLTAPKTDAATEGFNALHGSPLGDDDIPDFEANPSDASEQPASDGASDQTDAGEPFPGDLPTTGEGQTAGPAEANAVEGTGSAVDVIAWADKLIDDLPFMRPEQVAHLEQDRKELAKFAILKATDLSKAKALEAAIIAAKEG
ncbi:hypothetical protein [uncultured Brevundimonas sp.]|uniref:hypothetical protein n=1 Tax=uncultured Brevundimonas sp. TaxID=213418 RepID=UPI0025FBE892|nr:hypothetical protein [uncultured Brevundimonas sp.]